MDSNQHQAILNCVRTTLTTPAQEVTLSTLELILLFRFLVNQYADLAYKLYQHLWLATEQEKMTSMSPFQLSQAIALATLPRMHWGKNQHKKKLGELLDQWYQLQNQLDPQAVGIINVSPDQAAPLDRLWMQTLWIRNSETLSQLALSANLNADELLLELAVAIHETNRQLWSTTRAEYMLSLSTTAPTTMVSVVQYLPLWAKIPDQDRAEAMLLQLRTHAPPWANPSVDSWVSASSIFVYEGLQYYEMHNAAEELKDYLLQHCQNTSKNWLHACIALTLNATTV